MEPGRPIGRRLRALALAAILMSSTGAGGCHRAAVVPSPPATADEEGPAAAPQADAEIAEGVREEVREEPEAAPPAEAEEVAPAAGEPGPSAAAEAEPATAERPKEATAGGDVAAPREPPPKLPAPTTAKAPDEAVVPTEGASAPAPLVVARLPEAMTFPKEGPAWIRAREELVYRIEFLGITMGYARFVFNGKVLLEGREVFHVKVRAWTTSVLALIYPIDDTIDYYLDLATLAPLRQEYTRRDRKKENLTLYDQEKGTILYQNRQTGEISRRVDAVPGIYDPVTVAYFFRTRDLAAGGAGRKIYAGRKFYDVVPQALGMERIRTPRGEVEALVVRPVLFRDGKVEDKGDMRMWLTRDDRRLPVRVFAKFRKFRTWTLVGELLPGQTGS